MTTSKRVSAAFELDPLDVAREEGKKAMRERVALFLDDEVSKGRDTIPIALMRRMLEMWA